MVERLIEAISDAELARRWAAAERIMRDEGLDALVIQNSNDWLGGYVRWFTGTPANNAYPRTVLFFGSGDMTVIEMGDRGTTLVPAVSEPMWRGVREVVFNPSFSSIGGTLAVDGRLAADELAGRGARRVGWVNPDGMYHGFTRALDAGAAGVGFVDVSAAIDRIKAVKSPEEQALIRRTARLQDEVMAAVTGFVKPGLHDFEVSSYAQYVAQQKGSEQGIFLCSSSPSGKAAVFRPRHAQGRRIEHGDVFSLLVETNGPGGYYTELGRTFSLGRPANSLVAANRDAVAAQQRNLEMLKPGARVADIFARHNAAMQANGLPAESRLHCHGQGYDMVERPLVRDDDDMEIVEGMNIVIHPGYVSDEAFALVCDNYLIGPDGPGPCLHQTDQRLIVL